MPHRRAPHSLWSAAAVLLLGAVAAPAAAQPWDARADFSTSNGNPNGVWTYGYATALGSGASRAELTTYTNVTAPGQLRGWAETFCGDNTPGVYKNTGSTTFFYGSGSTGNVNAGQLSLHPGCGGQFSVVRFTAPTSGFSPGTYDLAASFRGADIGYRSVRLFQNGTQFFEAFVDAGASGGHASARTLAAGDVIDLIVGSEGSYTFDMVEANLTISAPNVDPPVSPVPEPGTWALMATGLVGVGAAARRRQRVTG